MLSGPGRPQSSPRDFHTVTAAAQRPGASTEINTTVRRDVEILRGQDPVILSEAKDLDGKILRRVRASE